MRITRKLGVLVGVPLAAALGFAGLAVVTTAGTAVRADELRRLVAAGAAAGELVYQLQQERASAVLVLARESEHAGAFRDQAAATDAAGAAYRRVRDGLPALPPGTARLVGRIDGQLARLPGLRAQVTDGGGRASAVAFSYRITSASLISFRESVGQAGGAPAEVADHLRAAAALSQAREAVGLMQVAVVRAVGPRSLSPAAAQEITSARTAQQQALQVFDAYATPEWRSRLDRSQVGENALLAQELEDEVARTPVSSRLRLDAEQWTQVTSGRLDALQGVEAIIDRDILAEVTALRDGQRLLVAAQVGVVLAVAAGALALAVVLGRPVVRGLRRLRDAAHEVAGTVLPLTVAQLEHKEDLGGLTAEQWANQVQPPLRGTGRDELAELARAFNVVHRAAIRTAAGQALSRELIRAMFVHLARRGQELAGQLTAAMDDLQRTETDKARLKRMFRIDLLITLLSRANDSLLVLGGGASARVPPDDDVPVETVLRAAWARVRQYERVEGGVIDGRMRLRATIADDVIHLLAELIDNACAYSAPATPVIVDAYWLGDRLLVRITDQGVGIPAERRAQINDRLASRPPLDLDAVKSRGLTVVSRLAERYNIVVELREAPPQGTAAEITLPAVLLTAEPRLAVRADRQRSAEPPTARRAPLAAGEPAGLAWPPAPLTRAAATAVLPPVVDSRTRELPAQPVRLPIFEEVSRSMWFDPAPSRQGEPASGAWQTEADAAWEAAARAAAPQPAGLTASGLPVRRRGAQLVPGGVARPAPDTTPTLNTDPASAPPPHRLPDPARVAAAASAFSRGLTTTRTTAAPPHFANRNGEQHR